MQIMDSSQDDPRVSGLSPGWPRLLRAKELCAELARVLNSSPCPKTIHRWSRRGLPYHSHPYNGQRYYLLPEVIGWLVGEPVSEDYRVRANTLAWKAQRRLK